MTASPTPFVAGSVSIGIYPTGGSARRMAQSITRQARVAEMVGFDGVTVSEHHAGFPDYLPSPLQACGWILAETDGVWAAPLPTLLLLRNPRLLVEELAWASARHPGRIALGVAAGYVHDDFAAVGIAFDASAAAFEAAIVELVASTASGSALARDAAVAAMVAAPVPLLSVANSSTGARRAARYGLGLVVTGGGDRDRLSEMSAAYRDDGGPGPVVLVRRVWCGRLPAGGEAAVRRASSESSPSLAAAAATGNPVFLEGEPEQLVTALAAECHAIGAQCVNLRIHLPEWGVDAMTRQIETLGTNVVADLRTRLAT